MHLAPMDDGYWTPIRVRYWLERYPQLITAVQFGCALDADDFGPGVVSHGTGGTPGGLATSLLCIKCDLERGLTHGCNARERRVLLWRYYEEMTTREIAGKMRVTHTAVRKITDRAVSKVACFLGFSFGERWKATSPHEPEHSPV